MMVARLEVIALDLEGTPVSNAMSQIARPGLHEFLEFCRRAAPRVVIYTSVPEAKDAKRRATRKERHQDEEGVRL